MTSIQEPGGFTPGLAVEFDGGSGAAQRVSAAAPLPVETRIAAASSSALTGSTSSASTTLGPFTPQLGRAMWITLAGTWSGSVQLLRSIDGGTTKLPLTAGGQSWASFTGNAQEQLASPSEAGETYYLSVALAAGTLSYRVSQ